MDYSTQEHVNVIVIQHGLVQVITIFSFFLINFTTLVYIYIACTELKCDTEFDICQTYSEEQCLRLQIYSLCPSLCGYDAETTTVLKPCSNSPSTTAFSTTTTIATTRTTTRNQVIATIQTTIGKIRDFLTNFFNKIFNFNLSG